MPRIFLITWFWGYIVSALGVEHTFVTRFIRKLRGGSQPILVEASDGFRYVLKFTNNLQGPNVPFNEAMGTELYGAAGLSVPIWKPLNVTEEFLDQTPRCWLETAEGTLRPQSGLCFASRYLERKGVRLWEILPRPSYLSVVNKNDFHLAWLLDICARHTDNRQALFEEHLDGIRAVFVDHGHMFSGPKGEFSRPHYRVGTYLDKRIYEQNLNERCGDVARVVLNLDVDALWIRAEQLPKEWLTETALRNFSACLCVLSNRKAVRTITELIAVCPEVKDQRDFRSKDHQREFPDWILRAGVQGA